MEDDPDAERERKDSSMSVAMALLTGFGLEEDDLDEAEKTEGGTTTRAPSASEIWVRNIVKKLPKESRLTEKRTQRLIAVIEDHEDTIKKTFMNYAARCMSTDIGVAIRKQEYDNFVADSRLISEEQSTGFFDLIFATTKRENLLGDKYLTIEDFVHCIVRIAERRYFMAKLPKATEKLLERIAMYAPQMNVDEGFELMFKHPEIIKTIKAHHTQLCKIYKSFSLQSDTLTTVMEESMDIQEFIDMIKRVQRTQGVCKGITAKLMREAFVRCNLDDIMRETGESGDDDEKTKLDFDEFLEAITRLFYHRHKEGRVNRTKARELGTFLTGIERALFLEVSQTHLTKKEKKFFEWEPELLSMDEWKELEREYRLNNGLEDPPEKIEPLKSNVSESLPHPSGLPSRMSNFSMPSLRVEDEMLIPSHISRFPRASGTEERRRTFVDEELLDQMNKDMASALGKNRHDTTWTEEEGAIHTSRTLDEIDKGIGTISNLEIVDSDSDDEDGQKEQQKVMPRYLEIPPRWGPLPPPVYRKPNIGKDRWRKRPDRQAVSCVLREARRRIQDGRMTSPPRDDDQSVRLEPSVVSSAGQNDDVSRGGAATANSSPEPVSPEPSHTVRFVDGVSEAHSARATQKRVKAAEGSKKKTDMITPRSVSADGNLGPFDWLPKVLRRRRFKHKLSPLPKEILQENDSFYNNPLRLTARTGTRSGRRTARTNTSTPW